MEDTLEQQFYLFSTYLMLFLFVDQGNIFDFCISFPVATPVCPSNTEMTLEMTAIETLELLPTSSLLHREVHSFLPRQHDTFPSNTGAGGGETHIKDIVSVCLQGFCFLLVR